MGFVISPCLCVALRVVEQGDPTSISKQDAPKRQWPQMSERDGLTLSSVPYTSIQPSSSSDSELLQRPACRSSWPAHPADLSFLLIVYLLATSLSTSCQQRR